ncbi:MAG: cyclic nucleotide-binding domain-containing protein [Bdellovibrionota bacterium]
MNLKASKILWENIFKFHKSEQKTKIAFLKSIPFFSRLTRKQLEEVSHILHERIYEKDEFIFEMNQPGAALFLIQEGEVSIEAKTNETDFTQIAILKDQSFFGELALLDESPRSASARSVIRTHAWALFRSDLLKLSESRPDIACEIYKILANMIGERLKTTNKLLKSEDSKKVA